MEIRVKIGWLSCQLYAPAAIYLPANVGVLILLEAVWTPGLTIAGSRNMSLENFQGHYRVSNPEPSVLWRSASTNWTATHCLVS